MEAGVEWCVERCGGYTLLRCELEWGTGNHARGGGGKGAREDAAGARLDPESLLVAMARERSDAQLEGCGACDHAKASCEKEEGGHSYARAFTLQRDDVRLTDEERFRRGGLRHARGTHRRKGHAPFGRHASSGSCSSAALRLWSHHGAMGSIAPA